MNKNLLLTSASLALVLSAQNVHAQGYREITQEASAEKIEPVTNRIVYTPDTHDKSDPFEAFNRPMFEFNMMLDDYILRPVAVGYRKITPKAVRNRVNSALSNLQEPISAVNHLLQFELLKSVKSLGRFAVNSTLGLAGMFDVATGWGWTLEKTDFDDTFATWCVPEGPYIVLPFMGSTTPRALTGRFANNFADPIYWATEDREDGVLAYGGYVAIRAVTAREASLEFVDDMKKNSVDFYTTVRSAYMQNIKKSRCRSSEEENQSYDFDFENEE